MRSSEPAADVTSASAMRSACMGSLVHGREVDVPGRAGAPAAHGLQVVGDGDFSREARAVAHAPGHAGGGGGRVADEDLLVEDLDQILRSGGERLRRTSAGAAVVER